MPAAMRWARLRAETLERRAPLDRMDGGRSDPATAHHEERGQRMHVLNWCAVIVGFVSGALWLYASLIKVPTRLATGYGGGIVTLRNSGRSETIHSAWLKPRR
jgi:hypothetical protein